MESGNITEFDVTCKRCGSKDVSLIGYCGQNRGYGTLECENCKAEETVNDTGEKE